MYNVYNVFIVCIILVSIILCYVNCMNVCFNVHVMCVPIIYIL